MNAETIKLDDYDWFPLDPGNPDGPRMAAIWGNPSTGPYGALLRVPGGFESPLHRHSRDERVVIISGTAIHWTEHESRDEALPVTAGESVMMPADVNHVSAAAPGEDCVEFITQDGPFDFTLA